MIGLVIVLLAILLVFGVSSAMNSYASARQAQVAIEVAQVAQINAWGNLVIILAMSFLIVAVIALVIVVFYLRSRANQPVARTPQFGVRKPSQKTAMPEFSMNDLIQLEMLRTLRTLNSAQMPALASPQQAEEPEMVELPWMARR
jgi:hypothetical protein